MNIKFNIDCAGATPQQCAQVATALNNFQKVFSPAEIIELSAKLQNPDNAKLIRQYKGFLK